MQLPALHLCRYGGEDPLRTQSSLAASPHRASGASCGIASLRGPSPPFHRVQRGRKHFTRASWPALRVRRHPRRETFFLARQRAERSSARPSKSGEREAPARRKAPLQLRNCIGRRGCPLRRRSASDQETRDRAERWSAVRGSARASVVAVRTPSPTQTEM